MLAPNANATTPVALTEPDDGPKWVEQTRTGAHVSKHVNGKPASGPDVVIFTDEDIESMVRGFYIAKDDGWFPGGMAPVGVDHAEFPAALAAVQSGEPMPEGLGDAAAFSDVRAERNDDGGLSLVGLHHYTESGRGAVRAKALRGYSVDAAPPGTTRKRDGTIVNEWVPFAGTLTNRPFVRGMPAVAASDSKPTGAPRVKTNTRENPMADVLNQALALSEGATDADRLKAIHALAERADKLATENTTLSGNLATALSDRDAAIKERDALAEWKQSKLADEAVGKGRCSEAERKEYLSTVAALGEEHAHKLYAEGRVQVAPSVTTPRQRDDGPETADGVYTRVFAAAQRDGKSLREAHSLADEASRDLRNQHYRNQRLAVAEA